MATKVMTYVKKSPVKIITAALVLALLLLGVAAFLLNKPGADGETTIPDTSADLNDEDKPYLDLVASNVLYKDYLYMEYAMQTNLPEGIKDEDIKMLFWSDAQKEYVLGNAVKYSVGYSEKKTAITVGNVTYNNVLVFDSEGVAAKEIGDTIYARACVEIDGKVYYSEAVKLGVLDYVYSRYRDDQKLGNVTDDQMKLYNAILQYGANAQFILDYNTDRLVTLPGVKIETEEGGYLTDGFTTGTYLQGDSVELVANATDENGVAFRYWADEEGNPVSEEGQTQLTVNIDKLLSENVNYKKYHPVYKKAVRVTVVDGVFEGSNSTAGDYLEGETITLKANDLTVDKKVFSHWTASIGTIENSTNKTITVTVPAIPEGETNVTYTAVYHNPVTVSVTGGTVNGERFAVNESFTVTATVPANKRIDKWIVDGQEVSVEGPSYTQELTPDDAGKTINVHILYKETVTVNVVDGTVNGSSTGTFDVGTRVTYKATDKTEDGYTFKCWKDNTGRTFGENQTEYTENIAAGCSKVTALYYAPTVVTVENGAVKLADSTGTGKTEGIFTYGQRYIVTVVVPSGKYFTTWSENESTVNYPATFEGTAGDHETEYTLNYVPSFEDKQDTRYSYVTTNNLLTSEALAALKEMDNELFSEDIYEWVASLYDPDSGAFYFSVSGRENYGYLADIETTSQASGVLNNLGIGVHKTLLNDEQKATLLSWVQTLQSNRDGYNYHPQWSISISNSRRGRDLSYASTAYEASTLYFRLFNDANYRISGGKNGLAGVTSSTPYDNDKAVELVSAVSLTEPLGVSAASAVSKVILASAATIAESSDISSQLQSELEFVNYINKKWNQTCTVLGTHERHICDSSCLVADDNNETDTDYKYRVSDSTSSVLVMNEDGKKVDIKKGFRCTNCHKCEHTVGHSYGYGSEIGTQFTQIGNAGLQQVLVAHYYDIQENVQESLRQKVQKAYLGELTWDELPYSQQLEIASKIDVTSITGEVKSAAETKYNTNHGDNTFKALGSVTQNTRYQLAQAEINYNAKDNAGANIRAEENARYAWNALSNDAQKAKVNPDASITDAAKALAEADYNALNYNANGKTDVAKGTPFADLSGTKKTELYKMAQAELDYILLIKGKILNETAASYWGTLDQADLKKQNQNGLWEEEITYNTISGLLKIVGFANSYKVKFLYPEDAIRSALDAALLPAVDFIRRGESIVSIYNPFNAINPIIKNLTDKSLNIYKDDPNTSEDEHEVAVELGNKCRTLVTARAVELIYNTMDKLKGYRMPDGGYAYTYSGYCPTSQGQPVAISGWLSESHKNNGGSGEGDVNGTALAFGTRGALLDILVGKREYVGAPMAGHNNYIEYTDDKGAIHTGYDLNGDGDKFDCFDLDGDGTAEVYEATCTHSQRYQYLITTKKAVAKRDGSVSTSYDFEGTEPTVPSIGNVVEEDRGTYNNVDNKKVLEIVKVAGTGIGADFLPVDAIGTEEAIKIKFDMKLISSESSTIIHEIQAAPLFIYIDYNSSTKTYSLKNKVNGAMVETPIISGIKATSWFTVDIVVYPGKRTVDGTTSYGTITVTDTDGTKTANIPGLNTTATVKDFKQFKLWFNTDHTNTVRVDNVSVIRQKLMDGEYYFDSTAQKNSYEGYLTNNPTEKADANDYVYTLKSNAVFGAYMYSTDEYKADSIDYNFNASQLDLLLKHAMAGDRIDLAMLDNANKKITGIYLVVDSIDANGKAIVSFYAPDGEPLTESIKRTEKVNGIPTVTHKTRNMSLQVDTSKWMTVKLEYHYDMERPQFDIVVRYADLTNNGGYYTTVASWLTNVDVCDKNADPYSFSNLSIKLSKSQASGTSGTVYIDDMFIRNVYHDVYGGNIGSCTHTYTVGKETKSYAMNRVAGEYYKSVQEDGHEVYYQSCQKCGDKLTSTFVAHNWVRNPEEAYLANPATVYAAATYYESCSVSSCAEHNTTVFSYGDPLDDPSKWSFSESEKLPEFITVNTTTETGSKWATRTYETETANVLNYYLNIGKTDATGRHDLIFKSLETGDRYTYEFDFRWNSASDMRDDLGVIIVKLSAGGASIDKQYNATADGTVLKFHNDFKSGEWHTIRYEFVKNGSDWDCVLYVDGAEFEKNKVVGTSTPQVLFETRQAYDDDNDGVIEYTNINFDIDNVRASAGNTNGFDNGENSKGYNYTMKTPLSETAGTGRWAVIKNEAIEEVVNYYLNIGKYKYTDTHNLTFQSAESGAEKYIYEFDFRWISASEMRPDLCPIIVKISAGEKYQSSSGKWETTTNSYSGTSNAGGTQWTYHTAFTNENGWHRIRYEFTKNEAQMGWDYVLIIDGYRYEIDFIEGEKINESDGTGTGAFAEVPKVVFETRYGEKTSAGDVLNYTNIEFDIDNIYCETIKKANYVVEQ